MTDIAEKSSKRPLAKELGGSDASKARFVARRYLIMFKKKKERERELHKHTRIPLLDGIIILRQ